MNSATASLRVLLASVALTVVAAPVAANKSKREGYSSQVLVSNGGQPAPFIDPNLKNAWGIAFNPTGVVWVNNQGTGKSTLYDGNGAPQSLIVTVPGPAPGVPSNPSGIVFSGGSDFVVTDGVRTGPARFIFATLEGSISGWAPNVNALNAQLAVPTTGAAVYTGLALGGNGVTHLLYAANFRTGRVDVFDGAFKPVEAPGGFRDRSLPSSYAPFGIQAINGDVYVTYAKPDPATGQSTHGPGLGFVNVFDPEGRLLRRVATRGVLNAPWGLALAPASFGKFGGALLVGNLGDGTINAYGPRSGKFLGALRDTRGRRLEMDGLWGIAFGNGVLSQESNALFFTAGPNHGADGAYGVITVEE
ncbi:MAG TPA: TIGR03118 family protein [Steroidobacteraceae bacterium]|nr:TIGR03118 family protein [Steroidobacteraceae bacterium]